MKKMENLWKTYGKLIEELEFQIAASFISFAGMIGKCRENVLYRCIVGTP